MQQHQGAPAAAQPFAGADWRLRATCRFVDPDLFFPISDSGKGLEQTAKAKAVCAGCAVRRECLAFAVRTRERHGIWGGMTEQERRSTEKKDQLENATAASGTSCTQDTEMPDRRPVKLNQGGPGRAAGAESISRAAGVAIVGPPRSGRELIEVQALADDDGAAEMEGHLRAVHFMGRLACRPVAALHSPGTARKGA